MLPPRLTEGPEHLLNAGASTDVLVSVKGFESITIGRYLHELEEWQIPFWSGAPEVEEWWSLPVRGTGNKP